MPPSRRYWFPKPYADFAQRLRVPFGFLLVVAFGWLARPSSSSLLAGLPVAMLGIALRAWAAGCLYKNQSLARRGPYAHTRNPLYLGTLLVAAGLVIATQRWELAVLFGAAFVFVYFPTIEQEEQHLRKLFPEYERYAAEVPLLIPQATAAPGEGQGFTWAQYRRNQEYNAAFGLMVGVGVLVVRYLYA